MKHINVGLIGFGTVGQGLARTLLQQQVHISKRTGAEIRLRMVADIRFDSAPSPEFADIAFTKDAGEVISSPDIDIVVELIGGIEPAKSFLLQAIAAGKHVVSANKALLATHGKEIFAAAVAKGVEVGFEASVGGGIPVIKALKEGLVANEIKTIRGILNGTANYILSQMTEHGYAFETVLKDAQAKGYAEADPTYDIEGIDTAHKLAILMTIAYGKYVDISHVHTEGISKIHPIDIEFAHEFGCRIKLLAISHNHGEHVEARVHPTMVPEDHMLANISGAFNAVQFTGDIVGDVLLYGQGAGMMPTGSAVAADVIDIGRNILAGSVNRTPALSSLPEHIGEPKITPMGELSCPYYFRITAVDKPGVLAKITAVFARHNISIKSMFQKNKGKDQPTFIVLRSHLASECAVQQAIAEIDGLGVCTAPTVTIRVLVNSQEDE